MWLIVGLGNPGSKYQYTRHNIGFMAVERFAQSLRTPAINKSEHKSFTSKFKFDDQNVVLALPQTFMNLSGDAVQSLVQFYKVSLDQLIVVHDDIDLPFGEIKMQRSRGHGGQNGIRDIHKKVGSNDYLRLRMGVGRPQNPKVDVSSHVLQRFSEMEMADLADVLDRAGDALEKLLAEGYQKASTFTNSKS